MLFHQIFAGTGRVSCRISCQHLGIDAINGFSECNGFGQDHKNQFFFHKAVSIGVFTVICCSADRFVYRYYLHDIKVLTKNKKMREKKASPGMFQKL